MPTVAKVMARTLAELGATRMYGLPGGEILDFVEAARQEGIRFVLTRREATASFMADAEGQLQRAPGLCVATLGPGAVNMMLGVANAFLDRSPVIAITASLATDVAPFATHQNLDLNGLYGPITKASWTLDGRDTAATIRGAWRLACQPRMGPVHLALPSDVGRMADRPGEPELLARPREDKAPERDVIERVRTVLRSARRPVVILGLDLAPYPPNPALTAFIERLGVPVFVAPKAKGAWPEDHPLFCGVCAGVAADHVVVDFFRQADLLVGIGYDPVESNRVWHKTMKLLSIGPTSIAAGAYVPYAECVGDVSVTLEALLEQPLGAFEWDDADVVRLRTAIRDSLQPYPPGEPDASDDDGVSPFALTRRLRELLPHDAIVTTDVGAVKFVMSQAFTSWEPMRFLQSNGLSSMGFAFPAAMAARLLHPDRPIVCTVGDGGFGMSLADVETAVRERLPFVTVVYNDRQLSLIQVIQQNKGLPPVGVGYGEVDFAAAASALGALGRRVTSLTEFDDALREGLASARSTVLDVRVNPREYGSHTRPCAM